VRPAAHRHQVQNGTTRHRRAEEKTLGRKAAGGPRRMEIGPVPKRTHAPTWSRMQQLSLDSGSGLRQAAGSCDLGPWRHQCDGADTDLDALDAGRRGGGRPLPCHPGGRGRDEKDDVVDLRSVSGGVKTANESRVGPGRSSPIPSRPPPIPPWPPPFPPEPTPPPQPTPPPSPPPMPPYPVPPEPPVPPELRCGLRGPLLAAQVASLRALPDQRRVISHPERPITRSEFDDDPHASTLA